MSSGTIAAKGRRIGKSPWTERLGGFLLGAVAVGLLAYAAYCLVQARYRRI